MDSIWVHVCPASTSHPKETQLQLITFPMALDAISTSSGRMDSKETTWANIETSSSPSGQTKPPRSWIQDKCKLCTLLRQMRRFTTIGHQGRQLDWITQYRKSNEEVLSDCHRALKEWVSNDLIFCKPKRKWLAKSLEWSCLHLLKGSSRKVKFLVWTITAAKTLQDSNRIQIWPKRC